VGDPVGDDRQVRREASPNEPKVELHIAGEGVVTLELDEQKAPKTVANFLSYVKKGHYDGTVFHRVIDGFMIQGGGFAPGMNQKPTDATVENEANNGLKNDRLHRGHGAHLRAPLGLRAVLHQRRRQRLPEPQVAHAAGLGLRRVRQGRERPGCRRPHQGRGHRQRGGHGDVPKQDVVLEKAVLV
jgi:peptidyl-prolyl cis-trans isomerase B (cyclophilin B)